MGVYMCYQCGAIVEQNSTPTATRCPKGGGHMWRELCRNGSMVAKPGLHAYQCRYCGTIIYCDKTPISATCHLGKTHLWVRL